MKKVRRLLILIPAYNEDVALADVLETIPKRLVGINQIEILVVDDGSQDHTANIAQKLGVHLVTHVINRGLGAALGTGFAYARGQNFDFLVTFDADGQHLVSDITAVLGPLLTKSADVVIGSRSEDLVNMPLLRRFINWCSNIATWVLCGIWTTDSQSGLRAFNKKAINEIQIYTQGMEVSSEFFQEIRRLSLHFTEVPVHCIYTDYSLTKGQRLSNAPKVMGKLVLNKFY